MDVVQQIAGYREFLRDSLKRLHAVVALILIIPLLLFVLVSVWVPMGFITLQQSLLLLVCALGLVAIAVGLELLLERGSGNDFVPGNASLSVRLMWSHQFQFCGFYHATSLGGININLRRGGAPVYLDPIACVLEEIDSFGIATAVDLIRWYHQHADFRAAKIIPCLVIFPRSPVVLIAKKEREISREALGETRIAFFGRADSTYREYVYLEKKSGIDNTHHIFLEDEGSLEHPLQVLESSRADYRVGYAFNEGLESEITGRFHWRYLYAVFGQTLAADVLFTRYDYWTNNIDLCRGLVTKVREGYAACAQDSGLVCDLLKKFAEPQFRELDKKLKADSDVTHKLTSWLASALERPSGSDEDLFIGNETLWNSMEGIAGWPSGGYTKELKRFGLFTLR